MRHNLQSSMRAEEGPKTILDAGDTIYVEQQPGRTESESFIEDQDQDQGHKGEPELPRYMQQ